MKSTCLGMILVLGIFQFVAVSDGVGQEMVKLEVQEETLKREVRHSQIGFRSTLIFYTFADQQTVLKLHFGNKDKTFPVSVFVHVFDSRVDEEGIEKWINNQHSDGLFADAPNPKKTIELPDEVAKVTKHEFIDKSRARLGEFENFAVEFEVADYTDMRDVKLKGFSGKTKVHVPVEE